MANWDLEKVQRFAPDTLTFERSERLLKPSRWRNLGQKGDLIWGEYRTSGVTWYRTAVALEKPRAFSNSPAKNYPDKYILALLRLFLKSPDRFGEASQPPEWVAVGFRRARQKESIPVQHAQAKQMENRERTRMKRLALMHEGVVDLQNWLEDIVRDGLGTWQQRSDDAWEAIASRMTDQKLGGLARRIRFMAAYRWESDWLDVLTEEIADLYLFTQAFLQLDDWPENIQMTLLQWGGVNLRKDDLAQMPVQSDYWLILGIEEGDEDNLRFRKTWMWAEKGQNPAYVLEFVWGNKPFEHDFKIGAAYEAGLIFYPGVTPMRAAVQTVTHQNRAFARLEGKRTIRYFLQDAARIWSENPWMRELPALLMDVHPRYLADQNQLVLIDSQNAVLPLAAKPASWKLLASYNGQPLLVFGKWTGTFLVPFTTLVNRRLVRLFFPERENADD